MERSVTSLFPLPLFPHRCCLSLPEQHLVLLPKAKSSITRLLHRFPVRASSSSPSPSKSQEGGGGAGYRGPKPKRDFLVDWVTKNDESVRTLPIFVGTLSLLAVLLNRAFSGIAPVSDATSSQSRADILTLALAVTNILAGLVWLSIRPKYISPESPCGVQCRRLYSGLPAFAVRELLWVWDSLLDVTCCRSLVVVHKNSCLLQIGVAAESPTEGGDAVPVDALKLTQGSLYQNVLKVKKQNYLANLSLYPGRSELPFLPSNTQAVILQPIGEEGIAIIGGDTVRGFTNLDQDNDAMLLRDSKRDSQGCLQVVICLLMSHPNRAKISLDP